MINEENVFNSRMSATANDHMQSGVEDKNIDDESKVTNEDKLIQPKKCMPMIFLKHIKISKSGRRIIIDLVCW